MNSQKMHTYLFKGIIIAGCLSIGQLVTGCKKSETKKSETKITPTCDGSTVTYTNTVQAIVNSSCVSCHSNYSTYSGLSGVINNGQFTKRVLTDQDMPKGGSLTSEQLNKIQCWVNSGFPE